MTKRLDVTADRAAKLYKELKSIRKVALALGASTGTIRSRLSDAGVVPRGKKNVRLLKLPKKQRRLYRQWRTSVFERDAYHCQLCGQPSGAICAHHICTWVEYPGLRFEISNGITLCHNCHVSTYKHEQDYEQIFHTLLCYQGTVPQWIPRPPQPKPTELACTRCGVVKSLEEFSPNRNRPWGVKRWCRLCHNAHNKVKAQENQEEHRRLSAEWYEKNREYRKHYLFVWRFVRDLQRGLTMKPTPKRIQHGLIDQHGKINYNLINNFIENKGRALRA